MPESTPAPIKLVPSPPGLREVVNEEKALAMIAGWTEQLTAHQEAHPNLEILCNEIELTDKSYTSSAATLIAEFLTSTEIFSPCIAAGIQIANLADIIASRMEEEGLEVLQILSNAFQTSRLIEVDLSDNAMGSKGVTACEMVLGGISVATSLQKLSLCNNGLSESTMEEVAELLTSTSTRGEESQSQSCIATRLSKLHFFNNMSGNNGCTSFQKIMRMCTDQLTDVRFSGTRAGAEGSAHIASTLSELAACGKLNHITRLDLADNSFGACYQDLANALTQCSKLQYLDLHDCCLGDDGIVMVCNALIESKASLTFLSLSGNDIGAENANAEGSKIIAALIQSLHGTLVEFHASENEMKSPGIRRIARALQESDIVTEIILNENECGTIGADALIAMAGRVPNLKKIELNSNYFLEDVVDRLQTAFGDKLVEMEDNIDDEDADDELDADELEEDVEEEVDVEEQADAGVDDLLGVMGNITV